MTNLDVQHGGRHYKDLAIQPIEYISKNKLGYFEGTAIKYLTRYKLKGKPTEDLLKAIHFIQLLLELEYGVKTEFRELPTPPKPEAEKPKESLEEILKRMAQQDKGAKRQQWPQQDYNQNEWPRFGERRYG